MANDERFFYEAGDLELVPGSAKKPADWDEKADETDEKPATPSGENPGALLRPMSDKLAYEPLK